MKKIKIILVISTILISFNSCTSLDEKVKEYGSISKNIEQTYDEISAGTKNQDVGIAEISKLNQKLEAFDEEVLVQYIKEEEIRREIEIKSREYKKQFRADSIKQAKIDEREAHELKKLNDKKAREEELNNKREAAAMIQAEEEADRNAYIEELEEKGLFLAYFDGEAYEINQSDWNNWKLSENYASEDALKYREMMKSMGPEKANGLANSMYRTLSNGIAREGITFKAVQGIQVYDVMTTGNIKFN